MKMFSDIIVMIEELSNRLLITDKNIVEITELIRLTSFNSISIFATGTGCIIRTEHREANHLDSNIKIFGRYLALV